MFRGRRCVWGLILRAQVWFGESGVCEGFRYDLNDRVCFGGKFCGGNFGVSGVCLGCQV